jgi:two-component system cell cycle sensor histidine kinase/response regulator CckA
MKQAKAPERVSRPTILVVDDDPAVLSLANAVLELAGYEVLLAESGWGAVRLYESAAQPVHLLLTDVIMPDLNGPVLAARLRAQKPDLKVLFISGFHDTQFVQRSMDNNFALLAKPFSPSGLLRAVRDCLDPRG